MMYFNGGNELTMTENPDYTEIEKLEVDVDYRFAQELKNELFVKQAKMLEEGRKVETHVTNSGRKQTWRIMERTSDFYETLRKDTLARLREVRETLLKRKKEAEVKAILDGPSMQLESIEIVLEQI